MANFLVARSRHLLPVRAQTVVYRALAENPPLARDLYHTALGLECPSTTMEIGQEFNYEDR